MNMVKATQSDVTCKGKADLVCFDFPALYQCWYIPDLLPELMRKKFLVNNGTKSLFKVAVRNHMMCL